MVKIGKLKEDGGDYKAFAEEVLATAEQIDAAEMKIRAMLEEGKTITEARALMKYHSLQTPTK